MSRVILLKAIPRALVLMALCCLCVPDVSAAATETLASGFVIQNKYISYEVKLAKGKDAEGTITNKLLGTKHTVSSPLFTVMTDTRLATISRSLVHKVRAPTDSEGAQMAQIVTTCPRAGLAVSILYELEPEDFFLRKTLAISKLEPGEVVINRIDVDVLHVDDPEKVVEFSGLGQPVYYQDVFFGVEYPACTMLHDGRGRIRAGYEYGLPVGLNAISSYSAVIGVASDGDTGKSFMRYVDSIRSRPAQPTVLWNSWYDLRDFDEKACLESLRLLREKFCTPYGIRFDSIVLDDGWDDHRSLWRVAADRFPQGFANIERESRRIGSGLGLWLSPWGGYGDGIKERIAYGAAQGFELLQYPGFRREGFCLAAPKYGQRFKECTLGFLGDYEVTYFKFDGFPSFCQNPAHGHRVGQYSQMALTDSFVEVLDSLKKKKRGLFINITTGTWHSPWWLQHADSVWMQGADFGYDGWGSVRQRSITYKDWRMHIAFRENKAQYPLNALMTVGIVKGREDSHSYRTPEKNESEKDWRDHVMMNLGMGTMHLELYISPSIMSEKELAFLGEKVRWWLDNAKIFSHTKMILGNPHLGEIYGYAHFPQENEASGKGLLFVRNPSLEKKAAKIDLDDSIDLPKGAAQLQVKRIYPAGESSFQKIARGEPLSMELEGVEMAIFEVQWNAN